MSALWAMPKVSEKSIAVTARPSVSTALIEYFDDYNNFQLTRPTERGKERDNLNQALRLLFVDPTTCNHPTSELAAFQSWQANRIAILHRLQGADSESMHDALSSALEECDKEIIAKGCNVDAIAKALEVTHEYSPTPEAFAIQCRQFESIAMSAADRNAIANVYQSLAAAQTWKQVIIDQESKGFPKLVPCSVIDSNGVAHRFELRPTSVTFDAKFVEISHPAISSRC